MCVTADRSDRGDADDPRRHRAAIEPAVDGPTETEPANEPAIEPAIEADEFDRQMMRAALIEARAAEHHGDVPVGAVVVREGRVIAARHNERELTGDPTAHAEVLALRDAARHLGHWRLHECTLYVTLEPCVMCAGAVVNARIARLVFGATDPKAGAVRSLFEAADDPRLNHRARIASGVLAGESSSMLKSFFAARR